MWINFAWLSSLHALPLSLVECSQVQPRVLHTAKHTPCMLNNTTLNGNSPFHNCTFITNGTIQLPKWAINCTPTSECVQWTHFFGIKHIWLSACRLFATLDIPEQDRSALRHSTKCVWQTSITVNTAYPSVLILSSSHTPDWALTSLLVVLTARQIPVNTLHVKITWKHRMTACQSVLLLFKPIVVFPFLYVDYLMVFIPDLLYVERISTQCILPVQ